MRRLTLLIARHWRHIFQLPYLYLLEIPPDARDELLLEMIALRRDFKRLAVRVLVHESQPSTPAESSGRHDSLESVESDVSAALKCGKYLMLISGVKYMGNDMSNFPAPAASDKAHLSALEYARMLRLLVKAEYATDLATSKGEIPASEHTAANHTRITSASDTAKNKFTLALPSFGKHEVLHKLLNGVTPLTVLPSFGFVKGGGGREREKSRSSRPPLRSPRLLLLLLLLLLLFLPLPFTRTSASLSTSLSTNTSRNTSSTISTSTSTSTSNIPSDRTSSSIITSNRRTSSSSTTTTNNSFATSGDSSNISSNSSPTDSTRTLPR